VEVFKSICLLLAGISVFLLGIKLMSSGLQTGAGKSVKKVFNRIGDNRFVGVGVGVGATATIQSSTAVTVMVVGFVNAGVMSLYQAAAIIMGANIGTTLTTFLGALGGLPIASIFMMTGIIGIFMYMFSKKKSINIAGQIITGLAIIFVGMNLMSSAFRGSKELTNLVSNAFVTFASHPMGPLLLFLIGVIFTATIQSSTATTVMIVTMAIEGVISPYAALFVVLGANLGTCLTTLIASIGTTPNAKRAALIHLSTDIFGFILFLPILWIFGHSIANGLMSMSGANAGLAISFSHLFYNLIMISILIWFIKPLIKLTTIIVPSNGSELEDPKLHFIDEKVSHPKLTEESMDSIFSEATGMLKICKENLGRTFLSLTTGEILDKNRIIHTEQQINYANRGIGRYLVKLSKNTKSTTKKHRINSLHQIVSDVERVGDRSLDILTMSEEMIDNKIKFSGIAVEGITELYETVQDMLGKVTEMFGNRDKKQHQEIIVLKKEVVDLKHEIRINHIERLNEDQCTVERGSFYFDAVAMLERIADLLVNISTATKTVI